MIYLGNLVGVLVVQEQHHRKFTTEEEAFLITVAQHLSIVISKQRLSLAQSSTGLGTMRTVYGVKGSPGIGIGKIHLIQDNGLTNIPDRKITEISTEIESLRNAVLLTKSQLESEHTRISASFPEGFSTIFSAYGMILDDEKLLTEIEKEISKGIWAPGALRRVITKYVALFETMTDRYFQSRAEDVRHIGKMLFSNLIGDKKTTASRTEKFVLFGDLVGIADIARFRPEQLVGILCQSGSVLSHTAVVANALGIPAVMGLGAIKGLFEGRRTIVDGHQGQVIFNPTPQIDEEYSTLLTNDQKLQQDLLDLKDQPAVTLDDVRINLYANAGLLSDISPGLNKGAEGIGLYRTELRFMLQGNFPTEEEQYLEYRHVLEEYQGKPVTMRTLDIGGDKILPYCRFDEINPSLGWRGIRFSLDNTSILITQIRAMLRASEGLENLQILLPMVSRVEEVDKFKDLLANTCQQLKSEGHCIPYPPVGVMVEVPAAITILHFLALRVDFISIGSNDLAQYLLAVDRSNPRVSQLFDSLHPAVLREINRTVVKAKKLNLKVGLCGEMASDPFAVVLLLGMGIDTLSMSAFNLLKIKRLIRSIEHRATVGWLQESLKMENKHEIREFLENQMRSLRLVDVSSPQ